MKIPVGLFVAVEGVAPLLAGYGGGPMPGFLMAGAPPYPPSGISSSMESLTTPCRHC